MKGAEKSREAYITRTDDVSRKRGLLHPYTSTLLFRRTIMSIKKMVMLSGIFILLIFVILARVYLGRVPIEGCIIGYNTELGGLVSVSLPTGSIQKLLPQRSEYAFAPAIDSKTSTIYYIDRGGRSTDDLHHRRATAEPTVCLAPGKKPCNSSFL